MVLQSSSSQPYIHTRSPPESIEQWSISNSHLRQMKSESIGLQFWELLRQKNKCSNILWVLHYKGKLHVDISSLSVLISVFLPCGHPLTIWTACGRRVCACVHMCLNVTLKKYFILTYWVEFQNISLWLWKIQKNSKSQPSQTPDIIMVAFRYLSKTFPHFVLSHQLA